MTKAELIDALKTDQTFARDFTEALLGNLMLAGFSHMPEYPLAEDNPPKGAVDIHLVAVHGAAGSQGSIRTGYLYSDGRSSAQHGEDYWAAVAAAEALQ